MWRVGCLPLIISISPSLNRRPSPGSRREWVCERGGALKTARSGGVWWGTPEINGASSPPLLYAECASPRETGLFPVHARWCPRGSRKGALRDRVPHPWDGWRARMPGRLFPGSAAGRRKTKPLEKPPLLAPRTSEGSVCGRRTPPLTWTLPSRTLPLLHNPAAFWTLYPLWTFNFIFLLNKSLSEAWRHTHCVCRLLLPPLYIYIYIYIYIYSLVWHVLTPIVSLPCSSLFAACRVSKSF